MALAQAVLAYLVVALAAGWVIWSTFLPRSLRVKLKQKLGLGPKPGSARFPQPVPRKRP
jgi:hypothetical protein